MKRILRVLLVIISIIVLINVIGYAFISYFTHNPLSITKTETVRIGPYICSNGLSLSIEQQFSINSFEGVGSRRSIKVLYGSTTFSVINQFQSQIEKNTNKTFKFDEYREYLDATQKSSMLPSQEELIARNIQPREDGFVNIATTDNMTREELDQFVGCFTAHKKEIYDESVAAIKKLKYAPYIWFVKAYAIVLSK